MHLLIINRHRSESLGGSELQCDLIARQFTNRGHDVTYLAVAGTKSNYNTCYDVENIDIHLSDLRARLTGINPDIIYWRRNKRGLLKSVLTSKFLGIPFVFGCAHDNDLVPLATDISEDSPIELRRVKQLYQQACSLLEYSAFYFVDGAIAQNEWQLEKLPVAKKTQIRNSYIDDLEPFDWPKPFVVWVGTVKQSKRPERFVELARRLNDQDVDFLMVGPLANDWLESTIRGEDAPSSFHYLGPKTYAEANGIIAASKFLVHTSEAEGFSNVLIQAWMNARPTVTLGIDPDNMISTHDVGFCCRDFPTLVARSHSLLKREELTRSLGARAANLGKQKFNANSNIDSLVEYLRKLGSTTRAPVQHEGRDSNE